MNVVHGVCAQQTEQVLSSQAHTEHLQNQSCNEELLVALSLLMVH